jgi:DNA/RNA-binding domain of Phe-tRNA-synthetase-like protein
MSAVRIAADVARRFPGLELAWGVLDGLRIAPVGARADDVVARVRSTRSLDGLREDGLFRAYRDFFWQLGIDPTKLRPSGEALNRRVLQGKELPRINGFVDAYNAASLATGVPIAAFDAAALQGSVELRFARAGEGFVSIGEDKREALQGHELILADEAKVIAFYPHRDSHATRITEATRRALLVACGVPGVPRATLDEALRDAERRILDACGGHRM